MEKTDFANGRRISIAEEGSWGVKELPPKGLTCYGAGGMQGEKVESS